MTIRTFAVVASLIFTLVALLHATRLLFGLTFMIGTWSVPGWLSGLGLCIASYMAYQGLRLRK